MNSTVPPGTVVPSPALPATVACPDCERAATVLGRFTLTGPNGPADYLRVRCAGPLTLLVAAADARPA